MTLKAESLEAFESWLTLWPPLASACARKLNVIAGIKNKFTPIEKDSTVVEKVSRFSWKSLAH